MFENKDISQALQKFADLSERNGELASTNTLLRAEVEGLHSALVHKSEEITRLNAEITKKSKQVAALLNAGLDLGVSLKPIVDDASNQGAMWTGQAFNFIACRVKPILKEVHKGLTYEQALKEPLLTEFMSTLPGKAGEEVHEIHFNYLNMSTILFDPSKSKH